MTEPMMAISLWQPWATLIMAGVKPYEWRSWAAPPALVGRRIVIAASARPVKRIELRRVIAELESGDPGAGLIQPGRTLDLLEKWWNDPALLPLASGLGTVTLGQPRRASEILPGIGSSDRWGWPVTDPEAFPHPVPARGRQKFWPWIGEAP